MQEALTRLHAPLQASIILEAIPEDCKKESQHLISQYRSLHGGTQIEDKFNPLGPKYSDQQKKKKKFQMNGAEDTLNLRSPKFRLLHPTTLVNRRFSSNPLS